MYIGFDFDSTVRRPSFDSHSAAIRPRYDHSTLHVLTCSGLVHRGLNK